MNWLAWRQYRKQFLIVGIFLAIYAAVTIPTGLHFWHTYQHALTTCKTTDTCNQVQGELFQSQIDQLLFHFIPLVVMLLPILLGLFWGVPFLAREYADGTNKLVWTQSISRRKWLTVKLVCVLLGAAISTAGFAALVTWWFKTSNAINQNQFNSGFSVQGIVPVAYSVFAVSLGIMFGAWFRRTMVALGVTLFALVAIVLILVPNGLRPHYETPLSYKTSLASANLNGPLSYNLPYGSDYLVLDQYPVSSTGRPINWSNPPQQCIVTPGSNMSNTTVGGHIVHVIPSKGGGGLAIMSRNGGPPISLNCLQTIGYQMEFKYQPSYRYWDFQRIEAGLYVALSILPIGVTYWLVLRRDA